ncbi:PqqD family protein [Streptomyces massasporeus]|uniref:PqqD family protein n=1 Tax=Streptomyces massasporeus TaxID=67324 RepID=UPI00364BB3A6
MRNYRGVLLVAGPEGENYELTESAEFIFRCIDGAHTIETIGTKVAERYGVSPPQAVADVAEFVSDLLDSRTVELV